MDLRSCNEDTGEIHHTHVRDVTYSGEKPVFRITLTNGQQILSSKDHRFLTKVGWQSLEEAVGLSLSPGNIATYRRCAELAVNGIEAYRDPQWLAGLRDAGLSATLIAKHAGVTIDQVWCRVPKAWPACDRSKLSGCSRTSKTMEQRPTLQ